MSNLSFSAKVRTITTSNSMKAFATLIINDTISIEGYKVFDGKNGLFVAPPSHKGTDKEGVEKYFNDVQYLEERDEDTRRGPVEEAVSAAILAEYKRTVSPPKTNAAAGKAQGARPNPTGNRPTARKPDPIDEAW